MKKTTRALLAESSARLREAGENHRTEGEWVAAESSFRDLLAWEEKSDNVPGQLQAMRLLGELALQEQKPSQAQHWFSQAAFLAEQSSDRSVHASILDGLGTVAYITNSFEEAEARYRQSLALREQAGLTSENAGVLYNLGLVAERRRDLLSATRWHEQSLELASGFKDGRSQLQALLQLASIAFQQNKFQVAEQHCAAALKVAEELGAAREAAEIHYRLGRIAQELCQTEIARGRYAESLALYHSLGNLDGHLKVVGHLASLPEVSRNQLHETYGRTLELAEHQADATAQSQLLYKLAELAESEGRWLEAEQSYRRCLSMEEDTGGKPQRVYVMQKLGLILFEQGRPIEADLLLRRSVQLGGYPDGDQPFHTKVLERLGLAALQKHDFEEALLYFQHGLKLAEDVGDTPAQLRALVGLGRVALASDDWEHAESWFSKALELADGEFAVERIACLLGLADLARRAGQGKEAEKRFLAALKLQQRVSSEIDQAQTLIALGELAEEQGRTRKACAHFQEAEALFLALRDAQNLYRIRTALRRLERAEQAPS